MKKMILLMAVFGAVGFGADAQTNTTYKTDMSTERIKSEERRGGSVQTSGTVLLNKGSNNMELDTQPLRIQDVQQWQGFSANPDNVVNSQSQNGANGNFGNRNFNEINRDDLPYRSVPYDTSKNNGHCIGCGSGTMTDPHPWK